MRAGRLGALGATPDFCHGLLALAIVTATVPASAQVLPSEPLTFAGGHLTVGGHGSASISTTRDEAGWFNYTEYDENALRLFRLGVTAALRAGDRVSILGEIRTDNAEVPVPYGLYLRLRPWPRRAFTLQAGRIPPTFGAFGRRSYNADNPLIGYPLAYQYLTSLRTDALPATADDLLAMRGRGWLASYPLGATAPAPGLPLVSAFRWDTGIEATVGSDPIAVSWSVTNGTLTAPRVGDDNAGKQLSVRVALKPRTGLIVGASAARGPYLSRRLDRVLPAGASGGNFTQQALGLDAEYSWGYWLLRAEGVRSQWEVPSISAPFLPGALRATAGSVEARYKIRPGLYAAARADHVGFNRISRAHQRVPWDLPITRVEVGGGYSLARNLIAKIAYQHNRQDIARGVTERIVATELHFWF